MVGRIFRVIFTRKAQRRRQQITDFEQQAADAKKAKKVQREIEKAAKKLTQTPEANPTYQVDEDGTRYRYTKAFNYKIIFQIFKKVGEVLIITVRHDAEDPDVVDNDL